jgi:hypothetical protein
MSTIEFKYTKYKEYYLPIIPIKIKGKKRWHEVRVFVDTGATYSVLNYKEAERLSLGPIKGERTYIKVGDGGYISIYLVILPIKIGKFELNVKIGFSKDLGIGFNILGRSNIFEKFTVCFDEKRGVIKFIKHAY